MDTEQTKLVEDNIGLANFLARLMWEKSKEVLDRDDLRSLAYQGLVSAALRWRPYGEQNGYSEESIASGQFFSVFARKRILGQIMDAMREADHVQRSVRSAHKAMLRAGYGQGVPTEEVSVVTGLTLAKIREVARAVENTPVSIWQSDEHGDAVGLYFTPYDHVGAQDHVHETTFVNSITGALVQAFDQLTELQQVIIVLRFYLQMELQPIGLELDLGLTVVRETLAEAVLSLHAAMHVTARDEID